MLRIAFVLIPIVVALLGWAATKPNTFRVERTTVVNAPPQKIVELIRDFHQWTHWSPFEKLDPAMQRVYSGAPSGKGAVYNWKGNNKAGEGRMEVLDVTPSLVRIKLEFQRPFKASNITEFSLQPSGETTTVTWAMEGPSLYIGKLMGLFFNMDKMIGKDFESGLASLKARAEA
ncbi:MAG TPA: SRPBCC family protein [Thermoanaerobaculia bacterium]|jgi:hypothetical protein